MHGILTLSASVVEFRARGRRAARSAFGDASPCPRLWRARSRGGVRRRSRAGGFGKTTSRAQRLPARRRRLVRRASVGGRCVRRALVARVRDCGPTPAVSPWRSRKTAPPDRLERRSPANSATSTAADDRRRRRTPVGSSVCRVRTRARARMPAAVRLVLLAHGARRRLAAGGCGGTRPPVDADELRFDRARVLALAAARRRGRRRAAKSSAPTAGWPIAVALALRAPALRRAARRARFAAAGRARAGRSRTARCDRSVRDHRARDRRARRRRRSRHAWRRWRKTRRSPRACAKVFACTRSCATCCAPPRRRRTRRATGLPRARTARRPAAPGAFPPRTCGGPQPRRRLPARACRGRGRLRPDRRRARGMARVRAARTPTSRRSAHCSTGFSRKRAATTDAGVRRRDARRRARRRGTRVRGTAAGDRRRPRARRRVPDARVDDLIARARARWPPRSARRVRAGWADALAGRSRGLGPPRRHRRRRLRCSSRSRRWRHTRTSRSAISRRPSAPPARSSTRRRPVTTSCATRARSGGPRASRCCGVRRPPLSSSLARRRASRARSRCARSRPRCTRRSANARCMPATRRWRGAKRVRRSAWPSSVVCGRRRTRAHDRRAHRGARRSTRRRLCRRAARRRSCRCAHARRRGDVRRARGRAGRRRRAATRARRRSRRASPPTARMPWHCSPRPNCSTSSTPSRAATSRRRCAARAFEGLIERRAETYASRTSARRCVGSRAARGAPTHTSRGSLSQRRRPALRNARARAARRAVSRPRHGAEAHRSRAEPLTPREHEILELLAAGLDEPRDRGASLPLRAHRRDARRARDGQARRQLARTCRRARGRARPSWRRPRRVPAFGGSAGCRRG